MATLTEACEKSSGANRNLALRLKIINNFYRAIVKDGDIEGRGHFSSPLVSSVGMNGRALFLPDISLTACRYLSFLIRAVAGSM